MLRAIELSRATAISLIRRLVVSRFAWLALFFSLSCVRAGAQAIDWPTLGFTQVVTNSFSLPIGITHAGDGSQRVFIVEKPGRVWIIQNNSVLAQPFLTITDRVLSAGSEQGLLGLAFPPGFATKKYFYVDYTRQPDGAIAISRFFLTATNSNVADTNSEQPVMVIPKPSPVTTYNNHNAGQLAFGPDGDLYIGVGDGGSEGDPLTNGQNTANFWVRFFELMSKAASGRMQFLLIILMFQAAATRRKFGLTGCAIPGAFRLMTRRATSISATSDSTVTKK